MKPIVSVIVPAYNASKTIDRCLESLIHQTINDIEIIVINDCSTDDTLERLRKYDNIVVINNEVNLGPAASRNKALDIAQGKYIGFVDSDDYVDLKMYETMVSKMTDEVDLVACSRINISKNARKEVINYQTTDDAKKFSATSNYNCDKLFKKSIIDKYHLRLPEEYSYAEDFSFGIRYKFYANKMCILQDPFYYYIYDSEGSITNSFSKNLLDIIDVLDDVLKFFKEKNAFEQYYDELINISAGYYVRRVNEFKRFNDKQLQRQFVKQFLDYFKRNFRNDYHAILNHYKSRNNKIYRSSYILMIFYIEYVNFKKNHK